MFPKFSFIVIVLNGMPFIEYALKAIYSFAYEIVVVEGAVEKCAFAANPDGSSKDETVKIIKMFDDPLHKIKLIQGKWNEKVHMQNAALNYVGGDYVWLVDSDEIYKDDDLNKVKELICKNPTVTQVDFIPLNFWKGFDYIFVSPKFSHPEYHYRRVFKFSKGARFISHRPPTLILPNHHKSTEHIHLINGYETERLGVFPYHYSYVTTEQVKQKIRLYSNYGWGQNWNIDLNQWYQECFLKWAPENRHLIEEKYPIWTGDRDSFTMRFNGTHPEVLTALIHQETTCNTIENKSSTEIQVQRSIGDPQIQIKTLQAWGFIELDEPLQMRKRSLEDNCINGKKFWNIHVALAFMAQWMQPEKYLEIGVRTGGSLIQVLHHSNPVEVVGVDLWTGEYAGMSNTKQCVKGQVERYLKTAGKNPDIQFIHGNSHDVLKKLIEKQYKFDLITVDGDHSASGAFEDLEDAAQLLDKTGAIIFDDITNPSCPGLKQVAFEFADRHPDMRLLINDEQDNGCIIFLRNIAPQALSIRQPCVSPRKNRKKMLVAQDYVQSGMQVKSQSSFADEIKQVFTSKQPTKIIETGTYLGLGTTSSIADIIMELGLDATFFSIEVNPQFYNQARKNLEVDKSWVNLLNGLSIPRSMLPSIESIKAATITEIEFDNIFVDHIENERATKYYLETDFNVPDNLLYECLKKFDFSPDFVLLDSAGHIGNLEFNYLIKNLKSQCVIALDDINHIKHHKSYRQILSDSRFQVLHTSTEKFGYCIVEFNPAAQKFRRGVNNIIWLRTDSIGDAVLSSDMLSSLRRKYPTSNITVLCQDHIKELYETNPHTDSIITFDRGKAISDSSYRSRLAEQLEALRPDLTLNPVFSREALTDFFAIAGKGRELIGFEGDLCNISESDRARTNPYYTRLIPTAKKQMTELERNSEFLRALAVEKAIVEPKVWLTEDDEHAAENIFKQSGFDPDRTVGLFLGAQNPIRLYPHYARALKQFCRRYELQLMAFGSQAEHLNIAAILNETGVESVNLCGQTSLRQTAALIKRCRMGIGAETGTAHMACAVGTPNVVVIGGGHFGRFMPYSELTTLVCLPLDCYGCNWRCCYPKAYCIQALDPFALEKALHLSWNSTGVRPRLVVQDSSRWSPGAGKPRWQMPAEEMLPAGCEILRSEDPVANLNSDRFSGHRSSRKPDSAPDSAVGTFSQDRENRLCDRTEMARKVLEAEEEALSGLVQGESGDLFRRLLSPELKTLPITEDDWQILKLMRADNADRGPAPGWLNRLMAAMLYMYPHQLPFEVDFDRLPGWFQEDYFRFLLTKQEIFLLPGETEQYSRALVDTVSLLHDRLIGGPASPKWRRLSEIFLRSADFIPAYFSTGNLKDLYLKRARIVETVLENKLGMLRHEFPPRKVNHRKIRLGIYLTTIGPHSETYATVPLFRHLNPAEFEVRLYVQKETGHPIERSARELVNTFVILPDTVRQSVQTIRDDDLDILVFGCNITANQGYGLMLANHRLARRQGLHFCNPVSSGLRNMDFFLLGEYTAPAASEVEQYSESVIKLPGAGICFDLIGEPNGPPQTASLRRTGACGDEPVFISGANFFKLIPELQRNWADILAAVPNSRLVLYPFGPAWSHRYPKAVLKEAVENVLRKRGVDPARLSVIDTMEGRTDILELLQAADVYLDAWPYNGATSLIDPLQVGLPPVVLGGNQLRFNQGAAILRELGLKELISDCEESYAELAIELGRDRVLRESLGARIRNGIHARPLFLNPERFAVNLEKVYKSLADKDSTHWRQAV